MSSRADVCAAAIADAFSDDGEIFASPMGLLPTLGVRLAKLTSTPDLVISDGESLFLAGVPPLNARADVVEPDPLQLGELAVPPPVLGSGKSLGVGLHRVLGRGRPPALGRRTGRPPPVPRRAGDPELGAERHHGHAGVDPCRLELVDTG